MFTSTISLCHAYISRTSQGTLLEKTWSSPCWNETAVASESYCSKQNTPVYLKWREGHTKFLIPRWGRKWSARPTYIDIQGHQVMGYGTLVKSPNHLSFFSWGRLDMHFHQVSWEMSQIIFPKWKKKKKKHKSMTTKHREKQPLIENQHILKSSHTIDETNVLTLLK